jgi:hypothetical protein
MLRILYLNDMQINPVLREDQPLVSTDVIEIIAELMEDTLAH